MSSNLRAIKRKAEKDVQPETVKSEADVSAELLAIKEKRAARCAETIGAAIKADNCLIVVRLKLGDQFVQLSDIISLPVDLQIVAQ